MNTIGQGSREDGLVDGERLDRRTPAFTRSLLHFVNQEGKGSDERCRPFHEWIDARRRLGVWPYSKVLMGSVGARVEFADEFGSEASVGINFGSQDYLGLASRPELRDAAHAIIDRAGIHSAGSPVLCGRTRDLLGLEDRLARVFGKDECILFPTGWAAGFGVVAGLVRAADAVVMDRLSHSCLQEGAHHATRNVRKFAHNDLGDLEETLRQARESKPDSGVFVVLESLYSMDSDSPDLGAAVQLARSFDAVTIVDVAHDFGAMGAHGLGLLETAAEEEMPDIVMGSFSKTFGTNGGFVACSATVRQYLAYYSPPHIFSNAISPLQVAVAARAMDLVFSEEGARLRRLLSTRIQRLRSAMNGQGLAVAGLPSPIVPVFVGAEPLARLASRYLADNGLLANLVEFPAVPRGRARFRFQVMATHGDTEVDAAAEIMGRCKRQAEKALNLFL